MCFLIAAELAYLE